VATGCYAHLATVETNLPVALTAFVGRKRELAEVGGLLFQDRMVTLCGLGGCGKTRLAVEAARLQLAAHPDGTSFVDLSAGRPAMLSLATMPPPSDLNQTVGLERADAGPKQCVGPHEIEGPLC